jgi:hypothetical protein
MASFEKDSAPSFQYVPEEFDWSDITPVPQDDGPDPVVTIAYTDECTFQHIL